MVQKRGGDNCGWKRKRSGHKTANQCMMASHKVLFPYNWCCATESGHVWRVPFVMNGKEAHMWMAKPCNQPQVPPIAFNHNTHAPSVMHTPSHTSIHTHHGAHLMLMIGETHSLPNSTISSFNLLFHYHQHSYHSSACVFPVFGGELTRSRSHPATLMSW